MKSYIGIDFGTTNTAVVQLLIDEQGSKITKLGENGEPFSSAVAIPRDGGNPKIGREVRKRREEFAGDHELFSSMKSYLGTKKEFVVGSKSYSAEDITVKFLEHVKNYIMDVHKIDIKEAGLAFPVDFTPKARHELCEAAKRAGIEVKCFISEPTAAFFANRQEGQGLSKVMVLDWGGGTFDISVLELSKNSVTEIAVFGQKIGGDDLDLALAKCVHAEIVKKSNLETHTSFDDMAPISRDAMIARCEDAKIYFSGDDDEDETFPLTVKNYGKYGTQNVKVSNNLFRGVVEPIIRNKILKVIDTALSRAALTPAGINAVVIVGGSSELTPYQEAITNIFGEDKIIPPREPQWSTAAGAAWMQVIGGNFKLNDSLGVVLSDNSLFPLLKAKEHGVGTTISPISFSITEDAQDAHFIFSNGDGSIVFERRNVNTKGFLNERIKLTAEIGLDQIARINIENPFMGSGSHTPQIEINKLTFHYAINDLSE